MPDINVQKQFKRYSIVFVVDSIVRCVTIAGFNDGKYGFMAMLTVWPVALAVFAAIFLFFIYTLIQIKRTVEILYAKKLFYFSPGWSVIVQLLFGHGIFGFILPIFIVIQIQKYQQLSNNENMESA